MKTSCDCLCRDLLNVLGMYPGNPGPPGADSSGVVVAVGPGVNQLRPGDAVFGLAAGSLGSHVHAHADTVVLMPSNLGYEESATTPTVFITVDNAFRENTVVRAWRPGVGARRCRRRGHCSHSDGGSPGWRHCRYGRQQQQAGAGPLAGPQPGAGLSGQHFCERAGRGWGRQCGAQQPDQQRHGGGITGGAEHRRPVCGDQQARHLEPGARRTG